MKAVPINKTALGKLIGASIFFGLLAMPSAQLQAHDSSRVGILKIKFHKNSGRLSLYWKGKIRKPMAQKFKRAIGKWKKRAQGGFIISLNSRGGSVREGYKVVDIIRRLKKTHDVTTYVARGRTCGSMCVPIFLTGNSRIAAGASLWLFHYIAGRDKNNRSRRILKPWKTDKMFRKYYIPAGVSKPWIDDIKMKIKGSDYWMTGSQVYSSHARIITRLSSNRRARKLQTMARR
jgi:ATP-dependent protease ClpP protease subunit